MVICRKSQVRIPFAWTVRNADYDRTTGPLFLRIDRHGRLGRF
jgi:hypothetical protein